ncbi:hypothetical protein BJF77_04035 [Kocuria sp. CNJ-770]|uniref:MarR family winged helix-turn-helix transcriptional regulator n=1 Tax=Kocuria sp. CNJ-770 TaxID=1904964 RepID=UPI000960C02E|nr:MarR family transcriptional regulator [Kocuria sp. CNJ-770]OLT04704.1 hypothetical protein BJF77_04035 [Kocuria sp. CNJ-770]
MTSTRPPERDDVDAIVAQWAQQRPELDTRAMEIFGRIYRLSGAPYRLAPKDLARSLMITTGGMTGRLTRLTDAGLIHRVPHPSDKRCLYAELTDAGLETIDQAVAAGVDGQAFVADRLGDEQARALADQLRAALQILTTTPTD